MESAAQRLAPLGRTYFPDERDAYGPGDHRPKRTIECPGEGG